VVTPDRWRRSLRLLDDHLARAGLAGPDPYDGLSGWLPVRGAPRRVRQAVVQGVKRSPVNLRPVLGIRPVRMTKTLALVAQALAVADWLPDAEKRRVALLDEIVTRLEASGGWGYEFDVQTRWGFYPAGSPNIIVTAFAIEALRTSEPHLDAVRSRVTDWLVNQMLQDGFIRYVPGSRVLIHNANLLGARALHRLAPGHPAVGEAVERTVSLQRADGTWPYGEGDGLEWIDGFHTAYVLAALSVLAEGLDDVKARLAVENGARAFAQHFFAAGLPSRYYLDRPGPVDVHNIATCVQVLSEVVPLVPEAAGRLPGAVEQLLALQGRDGAFRAHRGAAPYMRWNQAHACMALAEVTR
jgi:hypothetical protein